MANPWDATPAPDAPPGQPATGRAANGWILTNSVIALVLGYGIGMVVHQGSHWVAGALLGSRSYLSVFGVTQVPALTGRDAAVAALAGPAVSLIAGAAMQVLQPFRFRGDFAHLLWIWVACTSLMLAALHLLVAPWGGDIGVIVTSLRWPAWTAWLSAVLGLAAVPGVAHQWAIHAARLCGRERSRLRCFSLYPWLVGGVLQVAFVLTLSYLARLDVPRSQAGSALLGAALVTAFAPLSMLLVRRTDELEEPLLVESVPWPAVLVMLALGVIAVVMGGGVGIG